MLFEEQTSEAERELLRAWAGVRPSDDARKKTLVALGMAATGAAVGATGLAAGAGKIAGASIAPKATALGAATLLKWVALGVAVAGAAATTVVYVGHDDAAPMVAATALAPQVAASAALPAAPPVSVPASASGAAPPPPPAIATVAPAPSKADSLADQVAALDRARAALRSGDFASAVRLVDRYEAEYPRGAFTQEAEAVRVDALFRSGNRAAAESAARRFLAAYPSSPHAPRMRALLGSAQP